MCKISKYRSQNQEWILLTNICNVKLLWLWLKSIILYNFTNFNSMWIHLENYFLKVSLSEFPPNTFHKIILICWSWLIVVALWKYFIDTLLWLDSCCFWVFLCTLSWRSLLSVDAFLWLSLCFYRLLSIYLCSSYKIFIFDAFWHGLYHIFRSPLSSVVFEYILWD